jgi:hypothetical protein
MDWAPMTIWPTSTLQIGDLAVVRGADDGAAHHLDRGVQLGLGDVALQLGHLVGRTMVEDLALGDEVLHEDLHAA